MRDCRQLGRIESSECVSPPPKGPSTSMTRVRFSYASKVDVLKQKAPVMCFKELVHKEKNGELGLALDIFYGIILIST